VLLKKHYSDSYLACPQAAESEGKQQVSRQCPTGCSDLNSNTHHTMQVILCSFRAALFILLLQQKMLLRFPQHISVYCCNTHTHTFNHLKQPNSCDTVTTAPVSLTTGLPVQTEVPPLCTVPKPAPFPAMWTFHLQHSHVFGLSSPCAKQKPAINFHCYKCLAMQ
jgi:hypothetical protein